MIRSVWWFTSNLSREEHSWNRRQIFSTTSVARELMMTPNSKTWKSGYKEIAFRKVISLLNITK